MTTFRATFTTDHVEGKQLDAEFVRTALEDALEGVGALYVQDDDDREGEYDVTLERVEVVT